MRVGEARAQLEAAGYLVEYQGGPTFFVRETENTFPWRFEVLVGHVDDRNVKRLLKRKEGANG